MMKFWIMFFFFSSITLFASAQQAQVASGTIKHFENLRSNHVEPRDIDVWLPGNYSSSKKYAVLYMHDGQMLFDSTITWNRREWGMDETMGKLMSEKKIRDCIVVGVWNNGLHRYEEYFPQKAFTYLSDTAKRELNPFIVDKLQGDNYLKFLVTELKPFIDSTFSTLKDPSNTFMAGSSMGGLISVYAICEYPEVFGGVACLSTHWPGTFRMDENPVSIAIRRYMEEYLPSPKDHKIYFDHGTATLDSAYASFQKHVDELMKQKGYTSKNWVTQEFAGEDHSEKAWRNRFAIPAVFLLGN